MITDTHATLLSKELGEDESTFQSRLSALEKFDSLPLPSFRDGLSTSVDGTRIGSSLKNDDYHTSTEHKFNGAFVALFSEASPEQKELIKKYRYSLVNAEKDRLISLQQAACNEGLLVVIPAGNHDPIHIKSSYEHNGFMHMIIIAEENSSCMITREIAEEKGDGLICEVVEVHVAKGASLIYNEKQAVRDSTVWYSQKASDVKGSLYWYTHVSGSTLTKMECNTHIRKNANSVNLMTSSLDKHQHADVSISNYHEDAGSRSGMYAKSVVGGEGRLLYRGLVDIGLDAKDANGYQQEDVLLVGQKAEADAIPRLEIRNPNVACSHGATVGKMDQDALFYLQSRGLSLEEAEKMIVSGFLLSILSYVEDSAWAEEIIRLLGDNNVGN